MNKYKKATNIESHAEKTQRITFEGQGGEFLVTGDITLKGHLVLQPASTTTPGYDLVVDPYLKSREMGWGFVTVQVKSVSLQKKRNGEAKRLVQVPLVNRKNSSVAKNNRGLTHRYSKLVDTREIFYVPSSALPKSGTSTTLLLPGYEGRSKAIKATEKNKDFNKVLEELLQRRNAK